MSRAFVLSSDGQPLDPCHPARARKLLSNGRAAVFRRYPFTIILHDRKGAECATHPYRVKLDPGSATTGMAVVQETTGHVVWAGELTHRGQQIRDRLRTRQAVRRSRRRRKTRYRQPRFLNRRRRTGWLAPSLQHRVETTLTWVNWLRRLLPVAALSVELVRFDAHLMQKPDISGVAYQKGTLAGYEVKEYLLERWSRRCAYCGATGLPLQVEHIVPHARGGSDRISNLTLACESCNQDKGNRTAAEFGQPHIQAQTRFPLRDAAALNTTRWALYRRLVATGLPIEVGSGGRTKYNRTRLGLPKAHWIDATCVGASTPDRLTTTGVHRLLIQATGHGNRQMAGLNRYGFPIRHRQRRKRYDKFRTGDLVRAVVQSGKRAGTHLGSVVVRATRSFDIRTSTGRQGGIPARYCHLIHRHDGYAYGLKRTVSSHRSSSKASAPEGKHP